MRLRRFTSVDAMRADQMRYWRRCSGTQRIAAISEITTMAYAVKNGKWNVPRLQRTFSRVQRP